MNNDRKNPMEFIEKFLKNISVDTEFESETPHPKSRKTHKPRHNSYTTEKGLCIVMILPGYKEEDVHLEQRDTKLFLSLSKPELPDWGKSDYIEYHWHHVPPFTLPLDSDLYDLTKVSAKMTLGLLCIDIPLRISKENVQKIPIKSI